VGQNDDRSDWRARRNVIKKERGGKSNAFEWYKTNGQTGIAARATRGDNVPSGTTGAYNSKRKTRDVRGRN